MEGIEQLNNNLSLVLQRLEKPQSGQNGFAEDKSQNEFGESMLAMKGDSVLALALGAAFAGTIGGLFNSFINLGALGTIVGGLVLMKFVKSGFWHAFAKGVLVAGVASFLGGIVGGFAGNLLGGGKSSNSDMAGVVF